MNAPDLLTRCAGETKTDAVTRTLRALFAQNGYQRYEMSSFESYDMYLAHKNFLKGGSVVTFTDAQGRLKALKPDVTLSIVKNTKPAQAENKVYYLESVFRTASQGAELREIRQMGVEYIGGDGVVSEAEIVRLAGESLAAISADFVLNLSHIGFVVGFFATLTPEEAVRAALWEALRAKNAHALAAIAGAAGCTREQTQRLTALATLSGPFVQTLATAANMACCDEMHAAVSALQALYDTLCAVDAQARVQLDFSATSNVDYYNGLVLQGYVRGVPHAVLAGGRYDNLMRRFDKPQAAIGFAVYLGELGRALDERAVFDVDTLLLYEDAQSPALVVKAVQRLQRGGKSVRAAKAKSETLRAVQTLRLQNDGEVTPC